MTNPVETVRTPPGGLQEAYERSDFVVASVPPITWSVGCSHEAIDAWLEDQHARQAVVVTACNPFSEEASPSENAVRMDALEAEVGATHLRWLRAIGKDREGLWPPERSLCVFDVPMPLIDAWLERYGQYAVLIGATGQGCRLLWHPQVRDAIGS